MFALKNNKNISIPYLAKKPIQFKSEQNNPQSFTASGAIHQAAAKGVNGIGSKLPYFETIQKAFGRHDISHVQAYTGSKAQRANRAIGAEAYATGNKIAFADKNPSLHTAAHEAAHIIQQRAGVQLKSGIGRAGDQYEKQADAAADAVVRGHSAENILSLNTGYNAAKANGVQKQAKTNIVQRTIKNGSQTIASWEEFCAAYMALHDNDEPSKFLQGTIEKLIRPGETYESIDEAYEAACEMGVDDNKDAIETVNYLVNVQDLVKHLDPEQHNVNQVRYDKNTETISGTHPTEGRSNLDYKQDSLEGIKKSLLANDKDPVKPIIFTGLNPNAFIKTADGRHRIATYNAMGQKWILAELTVGQRQALITRGIKVKNEGESDVETKSSSVESTPVSTSTVKEATSLIQNQGSSGSSASRNMFKFAGAVAALIILRIITRKS